MATPTPDRKLANTSPFPVATTHEARRALATTQSLGIDTQATPQHDTEALVPELQPESPVSGLQEANTELQWPIERAPMLSDGPQVRSLPAHDGTRRGLVPMVVAGAAVVGALAIGVASWRHLGTGLGAVST